MFLTQQSVSHPPSTWAKGTICFPQPEKSSCHFANLQKKGKKKTPSAWLCEKREFAEHFHMFFSPCINFQCCTLSGDLRISPKVSTWMMLQWPGTTLYKLINPLALLNTGHGHTDTLTNRIRGTKISINHRIFLKKS